MVRVLFNILVMAAVIGVGVKWVLIQSGAPSWLYFLALPILGVVCYVTNGILTGYYIEKRAPDFANSERVFGDVRTWELTAGLGIVPKWVSWIGLMSIACFVALLMPVVAPLFKSG
jgi:hypothetical protein